MSRPLRYEHPRLARLDNSRWFYPLAGFVLAWAALAQLSLPLPESTSCASAQDLADVFGDRTRPMGEEPPTFDTWYVKVGLIVMAGLIALLFCFLVVFRWLLTKSQPWWPLSAYGLCMALVLTIVFGLALALFWNNLVMGRATVPKPWYELWGGRALLIGTWFLVVIIVLSVFRSPHARRAAKPAASRS